MSRVDTSRPGSAAAARAAGLTRGRRRGIGFARISHDLVVRLDDAINERERLALLATVLPPDAAWGLGTAAALLGVPAPRPRLPQLVLSPRRVLPQRADVAVHARRLGDDDVVDLDGLRVTSGAQTLLDMAPRLPSAELVVLGDALLRTGHLDPAVLTGRLARAGRVRGVVRARAVAPVLSPLAQSPPESRMRWWLHESPLPDAEPQVPVHDRAGRVVAHGDLGYADRRVLLEYEGRQHAEREQFERDVERYSLMAADGWLVLRFSRQRARDPSVVIDRTRRALLSRGWRPGPG